MSAAFTLDQQRAEIADKEGRKGSSMTAREQATILHELGLRIWIELWYENPHDTLRQQHG